MSETTYQIGAVAQKRIYSDVSAREFELFRQRAKAEGMRMGEALCAIASAYAHGDFYILTRDRSKQRAVNCYLRDHGRA